MYVSPVLQLVTVAVPLSWEWRHRRCEFPSPPPPPHLTQQITNSPGLPWAPLSTLRSRGVLMSSGFSLNGGVSRCFNHFQDINRCYVSV